MEGIVDPGPNISPCSGSGIPSSKKFAPSWVTHNSTYACHHSY